MAAFCLQIVVFALSLVGAKTLSSETTPPQTFNCESDLNPSFMVEIFCDTKNATGFIISERWVLTAASFLLKFCKPLLTQDRGCTIGQDVKCKEIVPYENYSESDYTFNISLLSAEKPLPFLSKEVPWPKIEGFTDNCSQMEFYSRRIDKQLQRMCTKVTPDLHPWGECGEKESLLCVLVLDEKVVNDSCKAPIDTGLAVCGGIVVGVLNRATWLECDNFDRDLDDLIFVKIEHYYTFIGKATGIAVPFQSSPRKHKIIMPKTTTTQKPKTTETTTMTTTTTPMTTPSENTTTESTTDMITTTVETTTRAQKKKLAEVDCEKTSSPSFYVDIYCNIEKQRHEDFNGTWETNYQYTYSSGFVLSKKWVLATASSLERASCETYNPCRIGGLNVGPLCVTIVKHDNVTSTNLKYDIALVEADDSLFWWTVPDPIPWPTERGFSESCRNFSLYGTRDAEGALDQPHMCATLTALRTEACDSFENHSSEPILCAQNKEPLMEICNGVLWSLAVCNNVVVGLHSHDHDKGYCEGWRVTIVLTRIEDYYDFIQKWTNIEVPFKSSPDDRRGEKRGERRRVQGNREVRSSASRSGTPYLLLLVTFCLLIMF